jgi:hypothetical protein
MGNGKHKVNPYLVPRMTPEQVQATQELRRSGAAGKHADRRTKRTRTRAAQRRQSLKDW